MSNFHHKKHLFLLLNLLILTSGKAQTYLSPLPDILSADQFQLKYYQALNESLLLGLNKEPLARTIHLPSWSNKQVVSVEFKDKKYYLFCRIIEQKKWHTFYKHYPEKSTKPLDFTEFKKIISKELAFILNELFTKYTSKTQFQDEFMIGIDGRNVIDSNVYVDGETYIFHSFSNVDHRIGQTRTPIKSTPMAELVQISIDMTALARDSGKEENLLISAKKLLDKTQN